LLPHSQVSNPDITRIINSDEIQTAVRGRKGAARNFRLKRNPLKNFALLNKLNPYAAVLRRKEILKEQSKGKKAAVVEAKRKGWKKVNNKKFHKLLLS